MIDYGLVLKNSEGIYFYGLNSFGTQLRKAQIYHDAKYAKLSVERVNSGEVNIRRFTNPFVKRDFTIVKVEIKEV